MSTTPSFALIKHPREPRVLFVQGEGGWTLPALSPKYESQAMTEGLTDSLLRDHAVEATVLRLACSRMEGDQVVFRAYEIETDTEIPRSSDYRWVTIDEAGSFPQDFAKAVAAILTPPDAQLRSPWAQPGWFAKTSIWIRDRLKARGIEATSIEQVKVWQLCCVLRAKTRKGDFYFKASAGCFSAETAITTELFRRHPGHTPEVIASDLSRRWLIAADLGGTDLAASSDIAVWKSVLDFYARVQIGFEGQHDALFAMGCPDRTLPVLSKQLTTLLSQPESLGGMNGMTEAEVEALSRKESEIRSWIDELASFKIPPMFEHGDLHPWNVRVGRPGGGFAIFDWSDGCLAHPFMFLGPFFHWMGSPKAKFPDAVVAAREELVEAYLKPFERYEPMDRLKRAFALGEKLARLHQAVSYHQFINPSMEDKSEWRSSQTMWLKALIELPGT